MAQEDDVDALRSRVDELEEHLYEAEQAVMEQEQELQELESQLKSALAAHTKSGRKDLVGKALGRERKRLATWHAEELQEQTIVHKTAFLELQNAHTEELQRIQAEHAATIAQMDAQHVEALHAMDKDHSELSVALHQEEARVAELKGEIRGLHKELRSAAVRQASIIDQAAKDVAEASLTGTVRKRSQIARTKAEATIGRRPAHPAPARLTRQEARLAAEDQLWDRMDEMRPT